MKFKEFVEKPEDVYLIPKIKKEKNKKINPKTNRLKTFKKTKFEKTNIHPKDRNFKNLPRYSDNKPKVRFQDWLLIKGQKRSSNHDTTSFGKSEADGKWYGWSHRAVYGFGVGDEITGDSAGKNVDYPKLPNGDLDWDNGKYEPDFTIKTDKQAREVAIRFAKSVS